MIKHGNSNAWYTRRILCKTLAFILACSMFLSSCSTQSPSSNAESQNVSQTTPALNPGQRAATDAVMQLASYRPQS
ncbi:MAG: hypothetical protein FWE76_09035, partial [Symbiobacteriaceae bacterium]|nr:hypothetical protein [Symbiobacteriaceae bacterium]